MVFKLNASDAGKQLLARLANCRDRIKAAYLAPEITEKDIDTLNELKAQCDVYQATLNGSETDQENGATLFSELLATINDWCQLIEGNLTSVRE